MSTTSPSPDEPVSDPDDEIARELIDQAFTEDDHAVGELVFEPAEAGDDALAEWIPDPADLPTPRFGRRLDGNTRAVARLMSELTEAQRQLALLAEGDPRLMVPSRRVLRAQRKAREAQQLQEADQTPERLALRDRRVRTIATLMVLAGAVIALAVSAIGVQRSAAEGYGLLRGDPGWWASFGMELIMSFPLLAVISVNAYSAMRGRTVDRKSPEGKKAFKVEVSMLSLTLILQCWPTLPFVAAGFDLLPLLVHAVGPIGACVGVWTLPIIWAILAALPMPTVHSGHPRPRPGGHPPDANSRNAVGQVRAFSGLKLITKPDISTLAARARELIKDGKLTPDAGVQKFAKELRAFGPCGTETARKVRQELRNDATTTRGAPTDEER